ncbi:MAG: glycosyltransferase family 2 protein, partial [Paracoccaceae bacterium]
MNAAPRVSVVVVSRDRPGPLSRCLTALTQLDYAPFEVIVAADDAGLAAVAALGLADAVKSVRVEAPGISAARNAGVAIAAGDVVAFIDDDAVAEPTWLTHLATPFAESGVEAAGGYVRGRNGISFQWRARSVNRQAVHADLPPADSTPRLLPPPPDGAIRTEGTNMAFRRETLAAMGGFDTGFRFFLDETDLNMRLAGAGALTAVVPLAQVHHGFAPSPRR